MDRIRRALIRGFLWILVGMGGSGSAFAFACLSNTTGNCTSAATWTACNGTIPQPGDTATILTPHVVTWDCNTPSGNSLNNLTVNAGGTLTFTNDGTANRLQITGKLQNFGTWNVGNDMVLDFNLAADDLGAIYNEGTVLSPNVSVGALRNVTALAVATDTGVCGTADGTKWTLTTDSSTAGLAAGDVVQFATGSVWRRWYEIRSVTATQIVVCRALADSLSAGPRFTMHQAVSVAYPSATFPTILPTVGDTFWAWKPPKIRKVGTGRWAWDELNTGTTGALELKGIELSGFGAGTGGLSIECDATRPPITISHVNLHDGIDRGFFLGASGEGCNKAQVTWNAMHDVDAGAGQSVLIVFRPNAVDPVDSVLVAYNHFRGIPDSNTVQSNFTAGADPVTRLHFLGNLFEDNWTAGAGENNALEMGVNTDALIEGNECYRVGTCLAVATSFPASVLRNVWRDNVSISSIFSGITLGAVDATNVAVNNYIGDTGEMGGIGGSWFYNVIRRWNRADSTDNNVQMGLKGPMVADGNTLDGDNVSRAGVGIRLQQLGTDVTTIRRARNNWVKNTGGSAFVHVGMLVWDGADFPVQMRHNLAECNANGGQFTGCACYYIRPTAAAAVTMDFDDNVCTNCAADSFAIGTDANATVTDRYNNVTRWPSTCPGPAGTFSVGTNSRLRDPLLVAGQANYQSTSSELRAGTLPVGSPIGVRARYFDSSRFKANVLAAMTLPTKTMNEAAGDPDGDGYLTFSLGTDQPDTCEGIPDLRGVEGANCVNDDAGAPKAPIKRAN